MALSYGKLLGLETQWLGVMAKLLGLETQWLGVLVQWPVLVL